MDELDVEIFKILVKDARTPISKIGKMLGVSKDRVKRRYERMKQRNPNLKSTVILDLKLMGFKTEIGFCVKKLALADSQKIKVELLNCPKIYKSSEAFGDFDFFVGVLAIEYDEYFEIYNYLEQIEGIESIDVLFFHIETANISVMSDRDIHSIK